jgi:hypothetical protein
LLKNFAKHFFANAECESFALEIVVGVPKKREVRAVLLQVETFGVDDGNRFFRVRKDLSKEISVQFDRSSDGFGWSLLARRCVSSHGNAQTGEPNLKGALPGS